LPQTHQRKWLYYKLFPNIAFDIYPDQVDFMQFIPLTSTTTMLREVSYADLAHAHAARDKLRAPRRPARDEGGALPQLAHQPPGECRGHRAHHARAAGHAVSELQSGAAGDERSVPEELRQEAQEDDPGGAAGLAATGRLEPPRE